MRKRRIGQDDVNKKAGTKEPETRTLGRESLDRTAGTRKLGKYSPDKTAGKQV
jgi:hypothetical protein